MYGDACCEQSSGGMDMEDKDKGSLRSFEVEIADNGFEIRARYAPKKKTLSQRKGWIPEPYCEPCKTVATSKADLLKQLGTLVKDCKDCSK
jgi:hypothetical protein